MLTVCFSDQAGKPRGAPHPRPQIRGYSQKQHLPRAGGTHVIQSGAMGSSKPSPPQPCALGTRGSLKPPHPSLCRTSQNYSRARHAGAGIP